MDANLRLAIISGTRPQFIKLAPIIKGFKSEEFIHINTNQHYDPSLSSLIFKDLEIPNADFNLNIGSNSHAKQTAAMMEEIEDVLVSNQINAVLVPGDTNSTLAGAISAIKLKIPVIHLEAGMRSYDWSMPEEINRILVDRVSSLLITTTPIATNTLLKEGYAESNIIQTGDTMVDTLYYARDKLALEKRKIIIPDLMNKPYFLATLHRASNVDIKENLETAIEIYKQSPIPIILPLHPRTKHQLSRFRLIDKITSINHLQILDPVSYLDFTNLEIHSSGILTDSGGIQKEAFILRKPCITMRDTTEWVETLSAKANRLLALDKQSIIQSMHDIVNEKFVVTENHSYGNGEAGKQIVNEIRQRWKNGEIQIKETIEN